MRSLLFVPAHNERLMASAIRSNADILLLDVEDSVQPKGNKAVARAMIRQAVEDGRLDGHSLFVRINNASSGELLDDLQELTIPGIRGFMYSKSRSEKDIFFLDKLVETIEFQKGIEPGIFKFIPLIETTSALVCVDAICKASPRIIGIAFGGADYLADLGGINDHEGQAMYVSRAMIAVAAKANGIVPIDTAHVNVHDLEELERDLRLAKKLGFEGMLVLHPKELPLVHQYFSPSRQEVVDAEEVLRLYEESIKEGRGVAILNGKFISPPMAMAAQSILEQHELTK